MSLSLSLSYKKEYRLYFQNEKTESIIHFKMSLFKFGFTSTALFWKSLSGNLTFLEEKIGNLSLNLGT